ncbi:hypothetical protein D3C76_1380040 [compost metagenome]
MPAGRAASSSGSRAAPFSDKALMVTVSPNAVMRSALSTSSRLLRSSLLSISADSSSRVAGRAPQTWWNRAVGLWRYTASQVSNSRCVLAVCILLFSYSVHKKARIVAGLVSVCILHTSDTAR